MSVNPLLLQQAIDLYKAADNVPNSTHSAVWDTLLVTIEGLYNQTAKKSISDTKQVVSAITTDIKANAVANVSEVNSIIDDIVKAVSDAVSNVVGGIKDFVIGLISSVSSKVDSVITAVANSVTSIVEGVKGKIEEILGGIGDTIERVINSLITKVGEIIESIKGIATQIANGISGAISSIGEFISNAVSDAIATVSAIIESVIGDVRDWLTTAYNNVKQAIEGVVNNVKQWITDVYNSVSAWFNQTLENLKATYESVKLSIQDWIQRALAWLATAKDNIVDFFWKTVNSVAGWFKESVIPKFNDAIEGAQALWQLGGKAWDLIAKGDYQGAFDLIDSFAKAAGIPAPVSTIHSLLSAIAYFWQSISLQFIPLQVAASKRAQINLALDPIANEAAATALFKGVISEADYYSNAALAGNTKARAKAALEATKPLPSPGQAQQLFLRGVINEQEHDKILAGYGFSGQHITEIKSLYAVIPSITDIITMAVKEAFTPDIAQRFGQYQDLPAAFVSWAKKQGLTEDWASRYWAAHWELPSPQMGFTMYQRGIIEKDDLQLLLKALDVMPFWREKLINLSYNPPTRVDVRRMYKMGVITEEQVYKFMLDIGYSPDNARLLTDFTKRYSAPEDQSQQDTFIELARGTYSSAYKNHIISEDEYRTFLQGLKYASDDIELLITLDDYAISEKDKLFDPTSYRKDYLKLITQGYNRGLFNREDAKPLLIDLGYSEDDTELELSLVDYNRQLAVKDTLLQQLHNQYVGFMIDEVDLHTILDTFGFYAAEVDRLLEEWGIERNFRDKRPSLTDLKGFYNKGLITLDNLLDELRGLGYHERYIDLYSQTLAKA